MSEIAVVLAMMSAGGEAFAQPVPTPAGGATSRPAEANDEAAADARMERMIFILDATATPEERLRAMKLVEQVVQGEIAAMSANTRPGEEPTDRMRKYQTTLNDVQRRIRALEPSVAQQGLLARTANARMDALSTLATAQSNVLQKRREVQAKTAAVNATKESIGTMEKVLKEENPPKESADNIQRRLEEERVKLKTQTAELEVAKADEAKAEQGLRDAERKFNADANP